MSRTKAHKPNTPINRGRPKGRGNPLGVCHCTQCKLAKRKGDKFGIKVKRKARTDWKTNKKSERGIYHS